MAQLSDSDIGIASYILTNMFQELNGCRQVVTTMGTPTGTPFDP